ncbi:hypothetical protein AAFF_G00376680 [Aldrovandia affinis]|uniref:Uncharacterized protein n=1 Tax=Aldrovandia affinis TaxID=143900 RepID=A0AAD7WLW2_9TELE|nr:hypothetical protein AAFF_G00376680 [Aldrovandia affinis]
MNPGLNNLTAPKKIQSPISQPEPGEPAVLIQRGTAEHAGNWVQLVRGAGSAADTTPGTRCHTGPSHPTSAQTGSYEGRKSPGKSLHGQIFHRRHQTIPRVVMQQG